MNAGLQPAGPKVHLNENRCWYERAFSPRGREVHLDVGRDRTAFRIVQRRDTGAGVFSRAAEGMRSIDCVREFAAGQGAADAFVRSRRTVRETISIDNVTKRWIGFGPFFNFESGLSRMKYSRASFHTRALLGAVMAFPAAVALSLPAAAQVTGQGAVSGTVTDPVGAAVPKAVVAVTNVATNVTTTRTSTGTGYYNVSPLPPGEYIVTVSAAGFAALKQEHVTVDALQVTTVNPVLKIGAATETVEVTDAPPPLQTANATLGGVIENETYSELPIQMSSGTPRDPTQFSSLQNGFQSGGRSGIFDGTGGGNENEMYIEGMPMTTVDSQGDNRKLNQNLSIEAVEQTQVQTSGSGAQFQGVGVENFSIKQGTNTFHGNAYIFVRNTIFDTWNYFAKAVTVPTATGAQVQQPKPTEHQNELSVSLGGPILHDRLFFFGNYDRYHYRSTTNPTLQTIPTLAARTGDFSAYPYKIYDPTSYAACTAANHGIACVNQFMGMKNGVPTPNVIPQSMLSSTMLKLAANLPTPTSDSLSGNYLSGRQVGNDVWEFTGRLDWTITPNQSIALISTNGVKKFRPAITARRPCCRIRTRTALVLPS